MNPTLADIRAAYGAEKQHADDEQFVMVRWFFRPASFPLAWLAARLGLSANAVTWISLAMGIGAAACFATGGYLWGIAGAMLLLAWGLLDHVDGNLARLQKSCSVYGEFIDTISAYLVFAAFPLGAGLGACWQAGQTGWIYLLAGGVAALGNTLPRLAYQKMLACGVQDGSYVRAFTQRNGFVGNLLRRTFRAADDVLNPCGLLIPLVFVAAAAGWMQAFIVLYGAACLMGAAASIVVFCSKVRALDRYSAASKKSVAGSGDASLENPRSAA